MALQTFHASVRSAGEGLLCKANVRGFEVAMDEPKGLGGGSQAMNPVELHDEYQVQLTRGEYPEAGQHDQVARPRI